MKKLTITTLNALRDTQKALLAIRITARDIVNEITPQKQPPTSKEQ